MKAKSPSTFLRRQRYIDKPFDSEFLVSQTSMNPADHKDMTVGIVFKTSKERKSHWPKLLLKSAKRRCGKTRLTATMYGKDCSKA